MSGARDIDTTNVHGVSRVFSGGPEIHISRPPHGSMTRGEALTLAAWLVTMADDDDSFPAILARVQAS